MTVRSTLLAALLLGSLPAGAAAQATNFPGGSLTGYTGSGEFGTSVGGSNIAPVSGTHFGYVSTGTPDFGQLLSGPFSVSAGTSISFWVNFLTNEVEGSSVFNDFARARLLDAGDLSVVAQLYFADTFTSTPAGEATFDARTFSRSTGWIFVQHIVGNAGTYRLQFYAQDVADDIVDTALAVDDIAIGATTVPEPVSLLLLGTGLAGVVAARRRRRAAA